MAPELKRREHYSAFSIDMYALGVMLFVILQGCYPFDAKDDEKALAQAEKTDIQWTKEVSLSKAARALLIALMQPTASRRMSMRQLITDKWFAQEMASIAHILPPVELLPKPATRRFSSPKDDVRLRGARKSSAGSANSRARPKSPDVKQNLKKVKSADASAPPRSIKSVKSSGLVKSTRSRPKSVQKVSSRVRPRSAEARSKSMVKQGMPQSTDSVASKQSKTGKAAKATKTSKFSSSVALRKSGRHSKQA